MQPQQIPQPQVMPQNIQIPVANQPAQPQLYQIIQTEAPNTCEKCSKFFTGSTNIPILVFTILMSSFAFMIICVMFLFPYFGGYFSRASFFDFIFALCVWSRMAIKIETNTSTVKYGYLFFVNLLILSAVTLTFPLARVWNFVLFETILIALNNKKKKIKFFCCRIPGIWVIVLSVIYHLIFNWLNTISIIITIIYALIYNQWLSQKLNISNERVEKYENFCIINYFKTRFSTFVALKETLNQDKKEQPLVQDINNSVNMSFIPENMYPNYYSGIVPGQQVPLQQIPPVQGAINSPAVDINRPN